MGLWPEEDPDVTSRDPNDLNNHLRVLFEDVIGEPEGAFSHECVWKCSYKCFTCGKNLCYMILTFLCAVPYSLCWGCEFACITFTHIWEVTPMLKVLEINCACAQRFVSAMLQCCLAPLCESFALLFSKINVTNSSG